VVIVRKKSGAIRFWVDFRRLNDLVDLDRYEIPKISTIISQLRDMKYFTTIDLEDGFFQVEINPSDKEKTAFFTGNRLMQFTRMPQGFKNSPAIFQRTMNIVLKDLLGFVLSIYWWHTDFWDIKTKTWHKCKTSLRPLGFIWFERKQTKRVECQEKVIFLGFEISLNIVRPTIQRSQGIVSYRTPRNRKELQRFLGIINYYLIFVNKITDLLSPFYKLLGKDTKFVWGKHEDDNLARIKSVWENELELIIPDVHGKFVLEADASLTGLGAWLSRNGCPVAYISRTLTKAERNYGITEREVLAALWAMEKFKYYLIGNKFLLLCDHKAIEFIKKKIDFGSRRTVRWFERI
jgi:uncharacterized membrane protein YfbV (UPF0208 family)